MCEFFSKKSRYFLVKQLDQLTEQLLMCEIEVDGESGFGILAVWSTIIEDLYNPYIVISQCRLDMCFCY